MVAPRLNYTRFAITSARACPPLLAFTCNLHVRMCSSCPLGLAMLDSLHPCNARILKLTREHTIGYRIIGMLHSLQFVWRFSLCKFQNDAFLHRERIVFNLPFCKWHKLLLNARAFWNLDNITRKKLFAKNRVTGY